MAIIKFKSTIENIYSKNHHAVLFDSCTLLFFKTTLFMNKVFFPLSDTVQRVLYLDLRARKTPKLDMNINYNMKKEREREKKRKEPTMSPSQKVTYRKKMVV